MSERQTGYPYQPLGKRLKQLRIKKQSSLAEVSGAVEIDIDTLELIEQGKQRPAEDILSLLINHFDLADEEATGIWLLAGYEPPREDTPTDNSTKQVAVLMPLDNRILFTDDVHMHGNKDSLVISFMQTDAISKQSTAVSRVGMSTEQAKKLFELMRQVLYYHAQPKALPAPKKTEPNS